MRIITILTVMTIMTSALAYNFIREESVVGHLQTLDLQTLTTSNLKPHDKLDKLANVLQSYQQTNQEQFRQAQQQQARLNKMLVDLDARLRSVEISKGELITDAVVSNSIEQTTDEELTNSDSGNPKIRKVSETELSQWMDETLSVGYWDQDSSKQATDQAEKSLEKVSGVDLEGMQCSKRFCRATFNHEDDKQDAILDVFGEPPFLNEGFTVHEPDGRVVLYFAQPGESLEEFRSEVQESD